MGAVEVQGAPAAGTAKGVKAEPPPAATAPPALPPLPSCYSPRDDLPDAPYRLLHSLDNAHGGGAVTCVRFDRRGERLASGGSEGTAAIWDAASGALLQRLRGHKAGISDVAWSPDSKYLATASDDTTLRVWDAASGQCLRVLRGHTHYAACCAFSSGANLLVSGGFDEQVIVWDVLHARPVKVIPAHTDPISGVHLSGQPGLNELIASCSFDGLTRVWHTSSGRCEASLTDHANPPLASVRFTPNGQFLLTVTMDSRLLLWDPKERKVRRTYRGHTNKHSNCQACFVVHSHDQKQRYVACGSEDHHVYVWDLHSKEVLGVLRGRASAAAPGTGHCSIILSVDASADPERPYLASGGQHGDGSIKIWQHTSSSSREAAAAAGQASGAAAAVKGEAAAGPTPMDAS